MEAISKHVKDIRGQKFSMLTPVSYVGNDSSGRARWNCRCDCGNEVVVTSYVLVQGKKHSCGCYDARSKQRKDIAGQRFGLLTALDAVKKTENGGYLWRCKCDCGNETHVTITALLSGNTKSCGCLRYIRTLDLTGQKFGMLTALEPVEKDGVKLWRCVCECGSETFTRVSNLTRGITKSCGCLRSSKRSCGKCLAVGIDGQCILGYQQSISPTGKMKPNQMCPKPLTKAALEIALADKSL